MMFKFLFVISLVLLAGCDAAETADAATQDGGIIDSLAAVLNVGGNFVPGLGIAGTIVGGLGTAWQRGRAKSSELEANQSMVSIESLIKGGKKGIKHTHVAIETIRGAMADKKISQEEIDNIMDKFSDALVSDLEVAYQGNKLLKKAQQKITSIKNGQAI